MPPDFVRYSPEIETVDPNLDRLLEPIIAFWEKTVRESPAVGVTFLPRARGPSSRFGCGGTATPASGGTRRPSGSGPGTTPKRGTRPASTAGTARRRRGRGPFPAFISSTVTGFAHHQSIGSASR